VGTPLKGEAEMSEFGDKTTEETDQWITFNGIDCATGEYLIPPMTLDALAESAKRFTFGEDLAHYKDLEAKFLASTEGDYKVSSEFGDPSDLNNVGWGMIFPAGANPRQVDAILEAIDELVHLRKEQAGQRFKIYRGVDGYRWRDGKPETTSAFLARHGTSLGPVDPNYVPAYLLIVADPQSIPYQFQYELDVDYFVGRIYFHTMEEYARYAHSVTLAEKGQVRLPRTAAFFGVANPGDKATSLSAEFLVKPLADFVQQKSDEKAWGWKSALIEPKDADRETLKMLLGGSQTPALLFTASHGMGWSAPNSMQYLSQGALVCQDWNGPPEKVNPEHYLAAQNLPESNSPLGMIAFFFACYGAGTPYWDAFAAATNRTRASITARPFLAALPTHLLGHPNGGALAVVGHIERAYTYSFRWGKLQSQTQSFRSLFSQLLDGRPIGLALDDMNLRYASLATSLKEILEEAKYSPVDPYDLTFQWTATNDARGYAILGDPAVRLAAAPINSEDYSRPTIELVSQTRGVLPVVFATEALQELSLAEQQLIAQENAALQTGTTGPEAVAMTSEHAQSGQGRADQPSFPGAGEMVMENERQEDSSAATRTRRPWVEHVPPTAQAYTSPFEGLATAVHSYCQDETFGATDDLKKAVGPLVENLNQALKNVAEKLQEATARVATLEVTTSLVEDLDHFNVLQPDPTQFDTRFKTTISLTGDIHLYLSARHQDIDEMLVELHQQMVEQGQTNRLETIKSLGEMIASLFGTKM
jgi:hypothetical protein